jgi:hypothetical protein
VSRDSGTDSANGGWLRRLVRQNHLNIKYLKNGAKDQTKPAAQGKPTSNAIKQYFSFLRTETTEQYTAEAHPMSIPKPAGTSNLMPSQSFSLRGDRKATNIPSAINTSGDTTAPTQYFDVLSLSGVVSPPKPFRDTTQQNAANGSKSMDCKMPEKRTEWPYSTPAYLICWNSNMPT